MITKNQTTQQQEYQPKRSAFFESMVNNEVFPYYSPFMGKDLFLDPPNANRGVTAWKNLPPALKEQLGLSENENYQPVEKFRTIAVGTKSKYNLVRIPIAKDKPASYGMIDWVNFTFNSHQYMGSPHFYIGDYTDKAIMNDLELMLVSDLSRHLVDILGYGITGERENGKYHYARGFNLGENWGQVFIGGQRDSVMVSISGQGLLAAKQGWEKRLYDFLTTLPSATLTRVDVAHDNFNSKTTLDDYFQMYLADLFTLKLIRPKIKQDGDWVNANNDGRTLYIGKRDSGKFLRIYEKGKQLGGQFSEMFPNWVRVELQYGNKGRDIPFDILLNPGAYLAGGYPALANLYQEQKTIETKKKSLKVLFDRAIEITKHQFGKYIYAVAGMFGVEQAFQILTDGKEELPKRLDSADYKGFDKDAFLSGLNIDFKTLEELSHRLGFSDTNSFLNYHQFKFNPVPF